MMLTRRGVLAGASAALGGGLLGLSGVHFVSRRGVRRWAARLGEMALARDLGVEYLYSHPEEATEPIAAGWTLGLRSGAAAGQTVALRVNGSLGDERAISPGLWHRVHFRARPSDGPTLDVQLSTDPEWRPRGDFRTLGIGIDTLWDV